MHDDHIDGGLGHDLPRVLTRRGLLAGAGIAFLAACGSDPQSGGEIPDETAGPFPGNGSDGTNVLSESGIVRKDIRSSFAGATGVAAGIPLTLRLTLVDDGRPLEGAAVYVWHCDRGGNYSLYSPGFTEENYLRGVQPTDRDGVVTFQSIYPAAYPGRWPHIHLEVYQSLATTSANRMRTSQLALPEEVSKKVYATAGYEQSIGHLGQTSLDTDISFRDGHSLQMPTMTGSNSEGWTAELTVPV